LLGVFSDFSNLFLEPLASPSGVYPGTNFAGGSTFEKSGFCGATLEEGGYNGSAFGSLRKSRV
jgi:hypothetical protein